MQSTLKCYIKDFSAEEVVKCLYKEKYNNEKKYFHLGSTEKESIRSEQVGQDDSLGHIVSHVKTKLSTEACDIIDDKVYDELQNRAKLLRCEIDEHIRTTKELQGIEQSAAERIYGLAVTDLFVEKAIDLLDRRAWIYKISGLIAFALATIFIFSGVLSAAYQANIFGLSGDPHSAIYTSNQKMTAFYTSEYAITTVKSSNPKQNNIVISNEKLLNELISRDVNMAWMESFMTFMKSFTFYGLVVLIAVILKRFGKAVIDQSERLYDRRHALREGRLYIHLRHGEITSVEELERAFNWNSSQSNAFADINTEAMAPWGNVLKEVLTMFPKAIEASHKK